MAKKISNVNFGDRSRRGIYVLPNLLTTAALFAAFYGIIQSLVGHFEAAAIAILISMVLDGLDGRVARMTNTVSDFGKEYDSLVDVIAFGLTPALLLYQWGLKDLGKVGWLIAFFYVAATALRLARFNAQSSKSERYFEGLPCPMAAAVLASGVWTLASYQIKGEVLTVAAMILMLLLGLAMVSTLPYRSFKDLDLRNRVPFVAVLVLVGGFILVSFDPPIVLSVLSLAFFVSGPIGWLVRRGSHASTHDAEVPDAVAEDDSSSPRQGG